MRVFRVENPPVGEKQIIDTEDGRLDVYTVEETALAINNVLSMLNIPDEDVINVQQVFDYGENGEVRVDYLVYVRDH